MSCNNP